ncbi:MAG: anti-sigma factor family protein [Casimicrobium sp.]
MNEHIEQLLPWYVNGTLNPRERAEVERYLADHPEARADAQVLAKASLAMKASVAHIPETIGLDRALSAIRTETAQRGSKTQTQGKRPSATQTGWLGALGSWLGTSWVQPAFAMALVVIGAQSFVLFNKGGDEAMLMRGAPATAGDAFAKDRAFLRVAFKPTATEGEIRVVLSGANASFYTGPNDAGEYVLSVVNNDAARALELLKASNIVATANPSAAPTR